MRLFDLFSMSQTPNFLYGGTDKILYNQHDDVENQRSEPFLFLHSLLGHFLPPLHHTFGPHTPKN